MIVQLSSHFALSSLFSFRQIFLGHPVLTGKGEAISLVENGGGLLSSLDAALHFHRFSPLHIFPRPKFPLVGTRLINPEPPLFATLP